MSDSQIRPQHPSRFASTEAVEIGRIAAESGWQVAAHDRMRSLNPRAYRLAVDEYGGQLRVLLPLTPESSVLQLRCGWGPVVLNLASFTSSVLAMDDEVAKLRFVAARRDEMGNGHLHTVCGSPSSNLPLSSETYDAVILLDSLEQASSSNGRDWRTAQQAMLSEVMRVLRIGGWLLLGAVNRLGLARSPDGSLPHSRTFWGYRRALRIAGFQAIEFHAPLPSHKEPFFILPLDQRRPLDLFIDQMFTAQDYRAKLEERGLGAAYRLAQAAWRAGRRLRISRLARYVVPSYLVLAQK